MKAPVHYRLPWISVLFLIPGLLGADTLYLKNSRRIQGTVLDQSRTHVRIRTRGRILNIRKKSIRRITYGTITPRPQKKIVRKTKRIVKPRAKPSPKPSPIIRAAPRRVRAKTPHAPGAALIQSALLPGAGQWFQGRRGAAMTAGIGTAGLLIASYFLLDSFQDAGVGAQTNSRLLLGFAAARGDSNAALAAGLLQSDANSARLRAANRLRASSLTALLLYVWNLADAYSFHPETPTPRESRGDVNRPGRYSMTITAREIRAGWEIRF